MLKTMVRRVGLATATCAVIAPLGMLPSTQAFAEGGGVSGHSSQGSDGGVNIRVSVLQLRHLRIEGGRWNNDVQSSGFDTGAACVPLSEGAKWR